jgi:hypothetical protein
MSVILLNYIPPECHSAWWNSDESHFSKRHKPECHFAECLSRELSPLTPLPLGQTNSCMNAEKPWLGNKFGKKL